MKLARVLPVVFFFNMVIIGCSGDDENPFDDPPISETVFLGQYEFSENNGSTSPLCDYDSSQAASIENGPSEGTFILKNMLTYDETIREIEAVVRVKLSDTIDLNLPSLTEYPVSETVMLTNCTAFLTNDTSLGFKAISISCEIDNPQLEDDSSACALRFYKIE